MLLGIRLERWNNENTFSGYTKLGPTNGDAQNAYTVFIEKLKVVVGSSNPETISPFS